MRARKVTDVPPSGALGAGLVIFSRFPIIATSIHPYSLNGAPIDVVAGDWFVGKAAASILIEHPILGEVQIFNTHVSLSWMLLLLCVMPMILPSFSLKVVKKDRSTIALIA